MVFFVFVFFFLNKRVKCISAQKCFTSVSTSEKRMWPRAFQSRSGSCSKHARSREQLQSWRELLSELNLYTNVLLHEPAGQIYIDTHRRTLPPLPSPPTHTHVRMSTAVLVAGVSQSILTVSPSHQIWCENHVQFPPLERADAKRGAVHAACVLLRHREALFTGSTEQVGEGVGLKSKTVSKGDRRLLFMP